MNVARKQQHLLEDALKIYIDKKTADCQKDIDYFKDKADHQDKVDNAKKMYEEGKISKDEWKMTILRRKK